MIRVVGDVRLASPVEETSSWISTTCATHQTKMDQTQHLNVALSSQRGRQRLPSAALSSQEVQEVKQAVAERRTATLTKTCPNSRSFSNGYMTLSRPTCRWSRRRATALSQTTAALNPQ